MLHRGFSSNQAVGLEGDPGFFGRITGPLYNAQNEFTGKWVVGVSQPGASGLRGQASVEESRLVARAEPPAYTQVGKRVKLERVARAPAPEHAPAEQAP